MVNCVEKSAGPPLWPRRRSSNDKVRSLKVKLRKRLEKKALEQVSADVGKHPAKEMKAMKGRKKTK